MTGRVTHLERDLAHPEPLAMRRSPRSGGGSGSARIARTAALFRHVVVQQAVGRMEEDRRAGGRLDGGDAEHVIDVGVGEPDLAGW